MIIIVSNLTNEQYYVSDDDVGIPAYLGECCYWYVDFPATSPSCSRNTMTTTVTLTCTVQYWLDINSANVEVKWYRSTNEQTAGIEGENLNSAFVSYIISSDSSDNNNITIRRYLLQITNFNISDIGYYWCQMVINNVSLPPSPYGYIYSPDCALIDITCDMRSQPLCALNITSQLTAHTQSNVTNCILENPDDISISKTSVATMSAFHNTFSLGVMSATDVNIITTNINLSITSNNNISVSITTKHSDNSARCDFSQESYLCGVGAILATGTTTGILLLLLVCLPVFIVKSRNKQRKSTTHVHSNILTIIIIIVTFHTILYL